MGKSIKATTCVAVYIAYWAVGTILPIALLILCIKMSIRLLPCLLIFSIILFTLNIILSPFSIFKITRGFYGIFLIFSGLLYAITLWFTGLLLSYTIWGLFGAIFGILLFGIGVVPVAMIGSIVAGSWSSIFVLVFMFIAMMASHLSGGAIMSVSFNQESEV